MGFWGEEYYGNAVPLWWQYRGNNGAVNGLVFIRGGVWSTRIWHAVAQPVRRGAGEALLFFNLVHSAPVREWFGGKILLAPPDGLFYNKIDVARCPSLHEA